jgi:hypothetical protein
MIGASIGERSSTPTRPPQRSYSMRRPDIALAITSCWISLVPSKIVWIIPARPARVAPWRAVH